MPIINIKNLNRSFGKKPILKNTSLQVEGGVVYGLVGLNGAGKTTLIRVMLGLLRRDGGYAEVCGHDPWTHRPELYTTLGVTLESDGFFGNLTVRENLKFFAEAKGVAWSEAEKYFETHWSETDIFKSTCKVKHLSRGQKVQCGLCRAFLGWPRAYFLDEPVVSLDFLAYEHFKGLVKEAKARGAAVLISSHQLETIDDLCDRVGLLSDGHIREIDRGGGKFSDAIKSIYTGQDACQT